MTNTTTRIFCCYIIASKICRWNYAEFMGRFESEEEAISKGIRNAHEQGYDSFEYRIVNMETDEIVANGIVSNK